MVEHAARLLRFARLADGTAASCFNLATASPSARASCSPPPSRRSATARLVRLAPADNQHDRHLGEAVLAHLVADLLVARCRARRAARRRRRRGRPRRRRRPPPIGDRGDDDLHRRQPQRETPGIMLDQDADEALHRAEDRAVQHDRDVARAVLADIGGAEPLGHVEIELQGAALPVAAERVAQMEFELRPVKGALAGVQRIGEPGRLDRVLQAAARRGPRSRRCRCAGSAGRRI